jgi:hypothetical protein
MHSQEHDEAHPYQYEIWKKMTADEKYQLFEELMSDIRAIKTASVRDANPTWDEKKVNREVANIFLYART